MGTATVTSKGQITIPADIRETFNLVPGDQIVFFKRLDGSLGVRIRRPRVGAGRGVTSSDMPLSVEDMNRGIGEAVAQEYLRSIGHGSEE